MIVSLGIIILGVGIGSVTIAPSQILRIIYGNLIDAKAMQDIDPNIISIIWKIRLPRAILAFIVGGALAASGAVMQSVLKNPLASSFTLGVSSGASLGAGLVIVSGFALSFFGRFTLPAAGLLCGEAGQACRRHAGGGGARGQRRRRLAVVRPRPRHQPRGAR